MNNELLGPDSVEPSNLSVGEFKKKQRQVIRLLKDCKLYPEQSEYHELQGSAPKLKDKAPEGFLNINNKEKELLPLRVIGSKHEYVRCSNLFEVKTEKDAKLTYSLCQYCQNDNNEWDYKRRFDGISITIQSMAMEQPDSHYTTMQSGEGRN